MMRGGRTIFFNVTRRLPMVCLVLLTVALNAQLVAFVPVVAADPAHHVKGPVHVSGMSESLPWRIAPAHSILLKELRSGRILYQHDSEKRLSPASLTKIMSALVILEKGQLADQATVSKNA